MLNIVGEKFKLVNEYLTRLRSKYTLRLVIVFGSLIKGSWTQHSDIDVVVVADELTSNMGENYVNLKSYKIEPLGLKSGDFVKELERLNLVLFDAMEYGKILFADEEFKEKVYKKFVEIKEKAGLKWVDGRWVWTRKSVN